MIPIHFSEYYHDPDATTARAKDLMLKADVIGDDASLTYREYDAEGTRCMAFTVSALKGHEAVGPFQLTCRVSTSCDPALEILHAAHKAPSRAVPVAMGEPMSLRDINQRELVSLYFEMHNLLGRMKSCLNPGLVAAHHAAQGDIDAMRRDLCLSPLPKPFPKQTN